MKWKALALGVTIGFLAAVVPSCGAAKSTCSAATCTGCCSADGKTCNPGTAAAACGASGNACVACTGTDVCNAGQCVPPTGDGDAGVVKGCGPGTTQPCATGCCAGTGATALCLLGDKVANCGTGGAACTTCGAGQNCTADHVCSGGNVSVGSPCAANSECAGLGAGAICKLATATDAGTYAGGYCTLVCGQGQSTCPSSSTCISFGPADDETQSLCTKNCTPPNSLNSPDCRSPGYACYGLNGNTTSGICWLYPAPAVVVDAGPPADKIGNPCTVDSNCQNPPNDGVCVPAALADGGPTGFPDGYCTAPCDTSPDHCGDGGICIVFGSGATTSQACEQTCTGPNTQGSCRSGYVCLGYSVQLDDGGSQPSTDGICRPNCNNPGWGCAQGSACGDAGFCQ